MNTISIVAFVVILLFVQEHFCNVGEDVEDFFKAIPGGVKDAGKKTGDAFESLWKAIKKPFTIRRMGRGGIEILSGRRRRKTTSTTTTELLPTDTSPVLVLFRRVPLPLLPSPEWRGMDNWNLQQLPRYALTKGQDYESRRRQISKWEEQYIGPQPTRITRSSSMPPAPPRSPLMSPDTSRHVFNVHVVKKTDFIKDDRMRAIDYNELISN